MFDVELTAEQEAEAARIEDILKAGALSEIRFISRLLASKSNRELFAEFRIREAVHRLGIDAALAERKKRGTKGRAWSARGVATTRGSKAIAPAG